MFRSLYAHRFEDYVMPPYLGDMAVQLSKPLRAYLAGKVRQDNGLRQMLAHQTILPCVFVFFLLCFALANCAPSACWCSTVVSSGLACSICAPPCYTAVFNLCSFVSLLHASGVLLEFPVTVLSVLKCTFGFGFCPVAVYTMILCSCRPL
jgi:hypothetical protein